MSFSCAVCGSTDQIKKCSGCATVAYCCINHQRQDWNRHKSSCKAWKVITDPKDIQRGRFVVSTRNIKAGEVILIEEPSLVGPRLEPSETEICPGCFSKLRKNINKCSKCDIPLCSEKCELSDYHQLECDFLQNSTNLQMEHLTILRFLGMKSKNAKKFKDLMTLVSNQETKKKGLDWLKITQKATEIISNYPKIQASKEDIQEIICKIESNSYQLLSADQESLNGIYVQASMLNHTCFKANSRPSFGSNYEMKIMATQDIEINTEITTNYLEPFHTNLQRRAILLRGKSFECCCQRCSDPTEFQTFASCSRCQFCLKKNNGYFVSSNSLNLSSEWRCNGCFTMINGKEAMEFDNNLSIECQKINRNNLTNIEKFINVYSDLLSENHIFLLQLKMWMIEGLNRLPYKSQEEDVLIKKLKLIKQVLQGLQAFEAPYSYVNGILHLEKADTMLMKLQQMFSGNHENMVNYMDPFEMVQEAQKSVKIAEVTFKNEDAKSTDHCLKMKLCDLKIALSSFM